MATLKTNTLTGTSTAGSIAVTGEGNSTTTNLQQGLCKAWFQVESDFSAFSDSFNMSGLTDDGNGLLDYAYTSSFGNISYSVTASGNEGARNTTVILAEPTELATGSGEASIVQSSGSNALSDNSIGLQAIGDLA